jgi:hypothetical protein
MQFLAAVDKPHLGKAVCPMDGDARSRALRYPRQPTLAQILSARPLRKRSFCVSQLWLEGFGVPSYKGEERSPGVEKHPLLRDEAVDPP